MSFKVKNWPEYEAALRRRGSLTLWIEDGALEDWQTYGPGGQARYTDAAIQTSLMLRADTDEGKRAQAVGHHLGFLAEVDAVSKQRRERSRARHLRPQLLVAAR